MRPKQHKTTGSGDLFRARLEQIINMYGLGGSGPQTIEEIFQNIKKNAGKQPPKPSGSVALN